MYFDGKTYDPELDRKRLSRQIYKVWAAMDDGEWRTLRYLSGATGIPEASVSARLRDYRKPRFGGHELARYRGLFGIWWYKLVPKKKP